MCLCGAKAITRGLVSISSLRRIRGKVLLQRKNVPRDLNKSIYMNSALLSSTVSTTLCLNRARNNAAKCLLMLKMSRLSLPQKR